MLITSLDNVKIKNYIKLKNKKYRDKTNTYIVEGMHLVLEAYKAGVVVELILEKDEVLPLDLPITYVTHDIINKISTMDNPTNIMALCKKQEQNTNLGNKILMLDGVQDPGNLGTIIRSSVAFGIDSIILSEDSVDLYNPKVVRATQGMMFHTNIVRGNLVDIINMLKRKEYVIYGTNVVMGKDVRSLKSKDKNNFVLIMGNEGNGVSSEVSELVDANLYINMSDIVESLNVGVACSILLYELGEVDE